MSSVLLGAAPTSNCTDRADGDAALVTVCFSVQAVAEPGVMPRVLELFAKRGLVPQKWHSTVSGMALAIDVQAGGLGRDTADYIARCMRQIAGVDAVLTSERRITGWATSAVLRRPYPRLQQFRSRPGRAAACGGTADRLAAA